jgi:hypothetical protein
VALLAALVLALACREPQRRPPPPLPTLPPIVPSRPTAQDEPAPPAREQAQPAPRAKRREQVNKAAAQPKRGAKGEPPLASPAAPMPAAVPAAAASGSAPRATPAKKGVTVPQTAHVRAEFPPGLQRDLDADPRMQAWLERAFGVIDGCHARNRAATGVIEARLTMHESARPDATIASMAPALGSVVACATGALLSIKMPLFTGAEGTRYTVRLHFD